MLKEDPCEEGMIPKGKYGSTQRNEEHQKRQYQGKETRFIPKAQYERDEKVKEEYYI